MGIDHNTNTMYKKCDWTKYAVHSDTKIHGFFGEYRWLSNFHESKTYFEGIMYPSSENAFQAAKVVHEERTKFAGCSPAESKRLWRTCTLIDKTASDWDARKHEIMMSVVLSKFLFNKDLMMKLIYTGTKELVELNNWNDTFWGVDIKNGGENNLGKILMRIRGMWYG